MTNQPRPLQFLLDRLEVLSQQQAAFAREISDLRKEINRLAAADTTPGNQPTLSEQTTLMKPPVKPTTTAASPPTQPSEVIDASQRTTTPANSPPPEKSSLEKSSLEKFIGENLINKIGIAITVIGVAIGAQYSIEHDFISPLARIILGYLFGIGLLGVGMRLKTKYTNYSAVLVSGAIAILYFITYIGYNFYGLMPQAVTFLLMLVFTAFTIITALHFDRQIIALIGLVGAYAVPLLVSDDSGNVVVFLGYIAIVNVGILIIAFKKYWKVLYYAAFFLTWFIYTVWYFTDYRTTEYFGTGLLFLTVFFALFYLTFLAYKLVRREQYAQDDILLVFANSFIFFGIGYALLDDHPVGRQLLGLFAVGNAIIHFGVSVVVYRQQLVDRQLFYLVSGLVLVFITIAIPIQLEGDWVTLLWAGEAALLFWIGRTKRVSFYEKLSYPLMGLALMSLLQDWTFSYYTYASAPFETPMTPLLNIHFLSSMLFVAAFAFIHWVNTHPAHPPTWTGRERWIKFVSYAVPAILLFVLYGAFRAEIAHYWGQRLVDSTITPSNELSDNPYRDYTLLAFKGVWVINYSLLFLIVLSVANIKRFKSQSLGYVNLGLNVLALVVFLVQGLFLLSELREHYLNQTYVDYYPRGPFMIGIRYVSLALVAALLVVCYRYIRQKFIQANLTVAFDIVLYSAVVWIASSELLHWMAVGEATQSYKLALSILWGVSALLLIALGIYQKKKHLRIGAIALFAVTLLKLFFYDIAALDTIAKTIAFVSLGVLLLIISFLYNKYKHLIADEVD